LPPYCRAALAVARVQQWYRLVVDSEGSQFEFVVALVQDAPGAVERVLDRSIRRRAVDAEICPFDLATQLVVDKGDPCELLVKQGGLTLLIRVRLLDEVAVDVIVIEDGRVSVAAANGFRVGAKNVTLTSCSSLFFTYTVRATPLMSSTGLPSTPK
jgi:hypothetical protein